MNILYEIKSRAPLVLFTLVIAVLTAYEAWSYFVTGKVILQYKFFLTGVEAKIVVGTLIVFTCLCVYYVIKDIITNDENV